MHDHHCQCDRCCVARHVSKQVRKDPSWFVTITISLFFWTAIGGLGPSTKPLINHEIPEAEGRVIDRVKQLERAAQERAEFLDTIKATEDDKTIPISDLNFTSYGEGLDEEADKVVITDEVRERIRRELGMKDDGGSQ